MSWKKFSEQIFSYPYFKQLFRRYLWMIYVPLSIFFGFVFLCGVLRLPLAVLGIMIFPYAVFIVPSTALLLFHVYTQKTEAGHLFSMPITRVQNFVSTYLAGLLLILIPLLMMSLVYSLTAIGENMITFVLGMFFLAIIYYTYSVLGCLLGGTLATQLMMTGVISFGPLMLYVIINACISSLVLGNMPADYNVTIINIFCPLISGAEFIFMGHWSYWYCHVLLMAAILALCLYLVRIRPFELSGQPVIFPAMQNYLMRPVLYLNAVYLIFYLCSWRVFQENHFDTVYYSKMVTLLAGTGILVAFILNIWFSRDLKTLFGWKNFQQTFLMTLLACSLFLIPLRQKENSRADYPDGEVIISLTFPTGRNMVSQNYSTADAKRKIDRLIELIDSSRNRFVRNYMVNDQYACTLGLTFWDEENENHMYQEYYILPEDMNGSIRNYLQDLLISNRASELDTFKNGYFENYYRSGNGNLYDRDALAEAMAQTFSNKMPVNYFEIYESQADLFYDNYSNALSKDFQALCNIYVCAMTADDFETWTERIYAQMNPILYDSDLQEIYEIARQAQENGKLKSSAYPDTDIILENSENLYIDDLSQWDIIEANAHYLQANVWLNATMTDNIETAYAAYFEGNELAVGYELIFEKIDQQWVMSVQDLGEVSY